MPRLADLNRRRGADPAAGGSHIGAAAVPRPRSRWRTRLLLPLALLLTVGGLLAYSARGLLWPAIGVQVVPVIVKPSATDAAAADESAQEGQRASPAQPTHVLVQAPGWIEPSPYAISVPALTAGVVREVLVLEGEAVAVGQIVVRMIDEDAKLALATAEAVVSQRRADVAAAQQAVRQAEITVAVEQAAADELQDEIDRKRNLVQGGAVPAGEFRRMEIRQTGLQSRVRSAQSAVETAKAAIAQAQAALEVAETTVAEALLRLDRMQIKSPAAGVVLSRLVEPGTRISMDAMTAEPIGGVSSGTVLRLYDPTKLQVRVDVPLADAAKVAVGTKAEITTEALPDVTLTGIVTRAVHEANIQRNTVQFKVAIDAPESGGGVLKPEMLARVRFYGGRGSATIGGDAGSGGRGADDGLVLLLPAAALVERGRGTARVWRVEARSSSHVAMRVEVGVGQDVDEDHVVITSGLRPADRVIIDPPPSLTPGARVRVLGERPASTDFESGGNL